MVDYGLTVLAIFAILMIPGPSNLLLANSARHSGFKKSLGLIPAELLGYFYAIGLWWIFLRLTHDIWPALLNILHLLSLAYVLWLAFNLWNMKVLEQSSHQHVHISPRQLFYATFKNPKSLLLSTGIFPASTWDSILDYGIHMALFSAVLIPSAFFWLHFGDRIITGKVKGLEQEQFFKHSAFFLLLCLLPIMTRFFH